MSSDPHTPPSPSNLSIDQWDKVREENQLESNNEKTSPEEGMPCERSYQKKELTTDNSFEKRISEIREFLPNFPSAYNRFKETGADTVGSAFDLANILHTEGSVAEASEFYRLAFDLHDKRPDHYPLAQSLLQARLLCLLKAGKKVPEEEILELESLCIPYANYIRGVSLAWQEQEPEAALKTIGNAFEEFHTGEEIDSIYFEIASNFVGRKVGENLNNNQVPYKLYMYWDNNPPNEILSNFEYHSTLAGLPVKVFDREEASEWLYQNYGIEARELFLNARHPAEAADFLRVHIINRLGGWWLDADLKLKDENTLKFMKSFQGSGCYFTTKNNVIHNDFFGSTSNNLILNDCLLSLYRNSYLHKGLFIAYKTGPGVFNRAFSRLYHNFLYNGLVPPSTQIHKQDSFNTYIEEFDTPYKHTNPHWQNA